MDTPRTARLDRRMIVALVGILLVGVLATSGWIVYLQHHSGGPATGQSAAGPVLPTPSGAQSRFTNAAFGYTLQYPAEWGLNVSNQEAYMNVYVGLGHGGPGLVGFEITCAANPAGLSAQQWWHAHTAPANHAVPLGPVTLASGTPAYKSTGQGSSAYELYTMVHAGMVCQLINDKHGTAQVTGQAHAAINSFRWN